MSNEIEHLRAEVTRLTELNNKNVAASFEHMNRADAAEAREAKLREYYEANEAVAETGLFYATTAMFERVKKARAALSEKGGEQ